MHIELRVRTIYELVCYEQYYLQPDVVSPPQLEHCDTTANKNQKCTNPALHLFSANCPNRSDPDSDISQKTFRLDCLETTKEGTYCNMWHIHALSSVLNCRIRAIYPDCNHRIRHIFNRMIIPRANACDVIALIYIMWTRMTTTTGDTGIPWSPNHFVPCIPQDSVDIMMQSSSAFPIVPSMLLQASQLKAVHCPQIISLDPISLGFLVYIDAVCRL